MKTFIIVFVLAVLFVVGSAGMMRYFDNKHAIKKKNELTDESKSED